MRVYGWAPTSGGCHWYRIREPLRGLALRGHQTSFGPGLDDATAEQYDTVLTHILWEPGTSEGWEKLAANGAHRLVFDIDDDVWAYDPSTVQARHWTPAVLRQVERNLSLAHLVTTPSMVLAERVARFTSAPVAVLPNFVPKRLLGWARLPSRRFTVGYQGSSSHAMDLADVWPTLRRFFQANRLVVLRAYGQDDVPGLAEGLGLLPEQWEPRGWVASVSEYYTTLAMDLGLAPLKRHRFNDAKSAVRAVEYAALGIPGLFSDEPPYREWVADGVTGVLVRRRDDWPRMLRLLYQDHQLRGRMSVAARQKAADWTTEGNAWRWEEAYQRV